jgi:hypothetical protein
VLRAIFPVDVRERLAEARRDADADLAGTGATLAVGERRLFSISFLGFFVGVVDPIMKGLHVGGHGASEPRTA